MAVPEVVIQEIRVRVVRDEQVDEPVVVVVGGDDSEAVGPGRVGEAVRGGRLHEPSVADVLEEQIGLSGKPGRPDHDMRPVAPDERPLRPHDGIPRRLDVACDVEVQIAVAVGIEERASGAPAAGGDAGAGRHLLERAVATIAEQRVRSPVGDVEIEEAVAVEIAGARAAAPGGEIHARLPGDVLELPSPEVAIEGIAMWDTLTCRRELGAGHQVDVEQSVAVVVEQGDAAAGRFEDVVLGRSAAIHFRGQPRTHFKGHRHGRAVFGRWDVRRRGTHRRRVAAVRRILGLRLAVASLERQAERDVRLELSPHFFEEREDRAGRRRDVSKVSRGQGRELGRGTTKLASQRRVETRSVLVLLRARRLDPVRQPMRRDCGWHPASARRT